MKTEITTQSCYETSDKECTNKIAIDFSWGLFNGTLTISGHGKMPEYGFKLFPWHSERNSIERIHVKDGITSLSDYAFMNCKNLVSVNFSQTVNFIGKYAFYSCKKLKSIKIPHLVTSIEESVFSYCKGLITVSIPEGIKSIGKSSFYKCTSLRSILLPDTVKTIEESSFEHCNNITTFDIPSSVTFIGAGAFSCCKKLKSINVHKDNQQYTSSDGVLFNKNKTEIVSYPSGEYQTNYKLPETLTTICDKAFECTHLSFLEIPPSVASIGNNAFAFCSINEIKLPNSIEKIGDECFFCSGLKSITIPSSVTHIGEGVFGFCENLTEIIVEEGNPCYVSENSILLSSDLKRLLASPMKKKKRFVIPDSVKHIGNFAFSANDGSILHIPDSVISIGDYAFANCMNLKKVKFGSSLETIGRSAFSLGCDIKKLVLPKSLKCIEAFAFSSLPITRVKIPASIEIIEEDAFSNCKKLKKIIFPRTLDEWQNIEKGEDWDKGTPKYIVKCTNGKLLK